MLREKQVLDSVLVHYKGQPSTATITLDGASVVTISNLPNHTEYKTRKVTLPSGKVGYVPQFSTDSATRVDSDFIMIPLSQYAQMVRWESVDVTYHGDIELAVTIDDTVKTMSHTSLSAGTNDILTTRVYFPTATTGYIPHARDTNVATANLTIDGELVGTNYNKSDL